MRWAFKSHLGPLQIPSSATGPSRAALLPARGLTMRRAGGAARFKNMGMGRSMGGIRMFTVGGMSNVDMEFFAVPGPSFMGPRGGGGRRQGRFGRGGGAGMRGAAAGSSLFASDSDEDDYDEDVRSAWGGAVGFRV